MITDRSDFIEKVKRKLRRTFVDAYDFRDIQAQMQRRALMETVSFVEENMLCAVSFAHKNRLLEYALENISEGLVLEFGVYKGKTINHIAKIIPNKKVFGFDSFEGLPENWFGNFGKGAFALKKLPKVRKNVSLIKGWFNESLPPFLEEHKEKCAFIHVDSDLYSSAKTIFSLLKDRITEETVIVFDEYFNYAGWKEGEHKAFLEFVSENTLAFDYIGYCRYDEQVAIRFKAK